MLGCPVLINNNSVRMQDLWANIGLRFRKKQISAPGEKQEISEFSEILGQNQIDSILFKTKNDIIYIKNTNFGSIYFFGPHQNQGNFGNFRPKL
jgi:hypothetical protein